PSRMESTLTRATALAGLSTSNASQSPTQKSNCRCSAVEQGTGCGLCAATPAPKLITRAITPIARGHTSNLILVSSRSFWQRKRRLSKHISPPSGSAHVNIAEPRRVVERFASIRAFLPQFRRDYRSVAPHPHRLRSVFLMFIDHLTAARVVEQVC